MLTSILIRRLPQRENMQVPILEYKSVLAYNRDAFLIEHGDFLKAFAAIDQNFEPLLRALQTLRDTNGKSHVSLIPLLLLLQRQSRAAFEALAVAQSYQAWVLVRPGVEAVLIIGKWVDDPSNAKIWKNRQNDPKTYQKCYWGKALRSKSLPHSERIQAVLSKINDDFVHANPDYYDRHLSIGPGDPGYVSISIKYFDEDLLQQAHVFAFLHLLLVMQEALAFLFTSLFVKPVKIQSPLSLFTTTFGTRIKTLVTRSTEANVILENLGLWNGTA